MSIITVDKKDINSIRSDSHDLSDIEKNIIKTQGPRNCMNMSLFTFFKWDFYYYVAHSDYEMDINILYKTYSEKVTQSCLRFDLLKDMIEYLYIITFLPLGKIEGIISKIKSDNKIDVNFSDNYIIRYLCRYYSSSTYGHMERKSELVNLIISKTTDYGNMFNCLINSILYKDFEIRDIILSNRKIMSSFNEDQMDQIKDLIKNIDLYYWNQY